MAPDDGPTRTKEELVKEFRTREIVEAARGVIAEAGVADASMDRIAHAAGISKGTIYLYFKNKEELLVRAVRHGFEELLSRLRQVTEGVEGTRAKLEALARTSLEHSERSQGFFQALAQPAVLGPEGASLLVTQFTEQMDAFVGLVATLIQAGIRGGELRDVPPRAAADHFIGALRSAIVSRVRSPAPEGADAAAQTIVDLFFEGVAAKGTP